MGSFPPRMAALESEDAAAVAGVVLVAGVVVLDEEQAATSRVARPDC